MSTTKPNKAKQPNRRRAATTVQIIDPKLVMIIPDPPPCPPSLPAQSK